MNGNTHYFKRIFSQVKFMLLPYAASMDVQVNQQDTYYLAYGHSGKTFAYIQVMEFFVKFYFHPLENRPELLLNCSRNLLEARKPKGIFYFKQSMKTKEVINELFGIIKELQTKEVKRVIKYHLKPAGPGRKFR